MEHVWIVPRAALFGGSWPQGFHPLEPGAGAELRRRMVREGSFAPRPQAEDNPAWKQPIPYCVVRRGGETLCVQRTKAQGEARLHDKLSIGIGGHVNPPDLASSPEIEDFFLRSLCRELCEELVIPADLARRAHFVGLLNDDSNSVGAVHVGLVYSLQLAGLPGAESVVVRERTKMSGGFRRLADAPGPWQDLARYETWSRVLLRSFVLDKDAPATEPRT